MNRPAHEIEQGWWNCIWCGELTHVVCVVCGSHANSTCSEGPLTSRESLPRKAGGGPKYEADPPQAKKLGESGGKPDNPQGVMRFPPWPNWYRSQENG